MHVVLNMLGRQIRKQGERFREEGGFRERMMTVRLEERDKQQTDPNAPACPDCGGPMWRRTARNWPGCDVRATA